MIFYFLFFFALRGWTITSSVLWRTVSFVHSTLMLPRPKLLEDWLFSLWFEWFRSAFYVLFNMYAFIIFTFADFTFYFIFIFPLLLFVSFDICCLAVYHFFNDQTNNTWSLNVAVAAVVPFKCFSMCSRCRREEKKRWTNSEHSKWSANTGIQFFFSYVRCPANFQIAFPVDSNSNFAYLNK